MQQRTVKQLNAEFYAFVCHNSLSIEKQIILIHPNLTVSFRCSHCQKVHVITAKQYRSYIRNLDSFNTNEARKSKNRINLMSESNHLNQLAEQIMNQRLLKRYSSTLKASADNFFRSGCSSPINESNYRSYDVTKLKCPEHKIYHYVPMSEYKLLKSKSKGSLEVKTYMAKLPQSIASRVQTKLDFIVAEAASDYKPLMIAREPGAAPELTSNEGRKRPSHYLDYIIPPNVVSDELLIEYQVCGRKTPHLTFEAAKKAIIFNGGKSYYSAYLCEYCDKYHYGGGAGKDRGNFEYLSSKGKKWYEQNPVKANRFIHRVLTQD